MAKKMIKINTQSKWLKVFFECARKLKQISNDFIIYWRQVLSSPKIINYLDNFNYRYPLILKNDIALELGENVGTVIRTNFPDDKTCIVGCQEHISSENNYFDRIIAIHVLECSPYLSGANKEMPRLYQKEGRLETEITCMSGAMSYLYL